jgi:hypothetical protein
MTARGPRAGLRMRVAFFGLIGLLTLSTTGFGRVQMNGSRQVTVFGIIAIPNSQVIDPKLEAIQPQLQKLLPNHGFKLLEVKSKRLVTGQFVRCDLGGGYTIATGLIEPLDDEGKVRLKCNLLRNEVVRFQTIVSTPPNQLFFCDQVLLDGRHLLIGVGAR